MGIVPISWLIAFCTLLWVTGCSFVNSEREMRGQVFVLQKNGVTLKLSLVQIELVDESEVANRVVAKQNEALEKVKQLREHIAQLDGTLQQVETNRVRLVDGVARQQEALKYNLETMMMILETRRTAGSSYMKKETTELEQIIEATKQKIEQAVKLIERLSERAFQLGIQKEELRNQIQFSLDPIMYFEAAWDKVFAKATTDADGKFVVMVPKRARLTIAARTSREIGASTERYCWLLPVQGLDFTGVSLNNNNMERPPKETTR